MTDLERIKKHLELAASNLTWTDDPEFNPYEFSGGNFDDAYANGVSDGETMLARSLLETFFGIHYDRS